jgi:hypothetical protein
VRRCRCWCAVAAAVLLGVGTLAGCTGSQTGTGANGGPIVSSSSTLGAGSSDASSLAGSLKGASGSGTVKPIPRSQASSLDRELEAMEKELDSLGMPSESDLNKVEQQLK